MPEESTTVTYTVAEPFERALPLVRQALAAANLKIMGELNMSGRIQQALLIRIAPCLVLLARPFSAVPTDLRDAALTPLHVVVSARGGYTEVHVLRVLKAPSGDGEVSTALTGSTRLELAVAEALDSIGMRAGVAV